jgi:hypothetical protein
VQLKNDDNEDDEVEELLHNKLLDAFDPATWGIEPQSPWSQHVEQSSLVVPLATEPVQVSGMQPQGVGLYLLILLLIYFCIVTYKADGELPVLWKDIEEMLLTGTLPSQVYKLYRTNV